MENGSKKKYETYNNASSIGNNSSLKSSFVENEDFSNTKDNHDSHQPELNSDVNFNGINLYQLGWINTDYERRWYNLGVFEQISKENTHV